MKDYFKLQYKLTIRKLKEVGGLNPFFSLILLVFSFIGLSLFLFTKTKFAPFIYILFSLSFTFKLNEINRIDFLKLCFNVKTFKAIRIIENLTIALPFIVFLIAFHAFASAGILFILTLMISFVPT